MSAALVDALRRAPHVLPAGLDDLLTDRAPVTDEDLQLTLFVCYELAYRGWDDVDDGWEWAPSLIALRTAAECRFERGLHALVGPLAIAAPDAVPAALTALVAAADGGPSLSKYLERKASIGQFREFMIHRSMYHLKEADPHTWAIPRLAGAPKAALIEIQIDEYGQGQVHRMHAELFRTTLGCLGLSTEYGAYVDDVPAITLATNNLMSLFGLHRSRRGSVLGHLAAFEMTSSLPNRRYGNGLRRLGGSAVATRFFDEHVEADAVHEQIATHDMCGRFCDDEPDQVPHVLFGAASALAVDRLFAEHVLARWQSHATSLHGTQAPRAQAA